MQGEVPIPKDRTHIPSKSKDSPSASSSASSKDSEIEDSEIEEDPENDDCDHGSYAQRSPHSTTTFGTQLSSGSPTSDARHPIPPATQPHSRDISIRSPMSSPVSEAYSPSEGGSAPRSDSPAKVSSATTTSEVVSNCQTLHPNPVKTDCLSRLCALGRFRT